MDRKLLDAFSNLSKAIELMAKALGESKKDNNPSGSSITEALKSSTLSDQFKSLDESIKKTQDTNKDIVKNQKSTIDEISKEKNSEKAERNTFLNQIKAIVSGSQKVETSKPTSSNQYEQLSKAIDKKKQIGIKDGVKIILLIASGILAIGMAFKLIGSVDLKSVIALGLAMPLLAIAFERISRVKTNLKDLSIANVGLIMMAISLVAVSKILQYVSTISLDKMITISLLGVAFVAMATTISNVSDKIKGIDIKDLWKLPLVFVATSVAISLSSWILQYVKPIGLTQLLTTVLIAGAFTVLAFGINKMVEGIKNVNPKDLWKLPLVLVAASAAISISSWILQTVKPVGISQLITTILIAGAFSVLSFGLGKLTQSMDKINPKDLWKLPLVLIGVSVAIMYSSSFLSRVTPISFAKAVSTIFIAATFVVLSYGLPRLAEAVSKVSPTQAALMPLVLVELALAITLSSLILSKVTVIQLSTLINIAEQAILLTVVGVSLGFGIYLMDKMGLTIGKVLQGSVSLVILAGTIMISSILLSKGDYDIFPSLSWTLSAGITMLAFGVLAAIGGDFLPEITLGAVGLLIIAGTIMTSSLILSVGNYQTYPDLSWTIGVAASMLAFGVGMIGVGTLILGTGGIGLADMALGAVGLLIIAGTVVGTAAILNKGIYGNYPDISWAAGVGLSIMEFGVTMAASGIALPVIALGSLGMPLIANSIVQVSNILSKGNFTGGPSLTWALGTGSLVTIFGAAMLTLGTYIGGTLGIGYLALKAGSNAIKLVAQSIVDAGIILSTGVFIGGPTKEWSEGVGGAISAFAPVYDTLNKGGVLEIFTGSGSSPQGMSDAIITISKGIVAAATFFSSNGTRFIGGPTKEWSEGVGDAISSFSPVFSQLSKGGIFSLFTGSLKPEDMSSAISSIAKGIVAAATFFNGTLFTGGPTKEWSEGVGSALSAFTPVIDNLNKGGIFSLFTGGLNPDDMKTAIVSMSDAISQSSKSLSTGNYTPIPIDYMKNLSSNVKEYVKLISYLKGTGTFEEKIFGITVNRASEISRMADDYNKLADSITKLSGSITSLDLEKITALKTFTGSIVLMSLMDTAQFDLMMESLESKAKIFVDVINDIEKGVDGNKEISIRTGGGGAKDNGPGIQEVLQAMNRIETRLSQISNSNDNISRYVNEIRTPNFKMRKNK